MRSLPVRGMRVCRSVRRAVPRTIEPLEGRVLLSAVAWVGAGDGVNWTDPNNWSGHALPAAADDVSIGAGFSKLQLASGTQTINSLTSASPFALAGGTLAVATTFQTSANLTLSGGTLSSSVGGTMTVAGLFTWSGGTLSVSSTTAQGGIDFHGGGSDFLSGGTLTNAAGASATIGATGNVSLNLGNGATFVNAGTLTASDGGIDYNGGYPALAFDNTGTLNVTEPGNGTFAVGANPTFAWGGTLTFNNSGTVNVQTGTLSVQARDPGSTAGAFHVAAGATLDLQSPLTLAAGSTLDGAGAVNFQNGTINLNGAFAMTGPIVVSGAAVNLSAATVFSSLNFTNGTIAGSVPLAIAGLFTWSGGTLSVSSTTAEGGIDFNPIGGANYLSGALTNAAGQKATGFLYLEMENGTLNNAGTLTATGGGIYSDGGGTVANTGILDVADVGTTALSIGEYLTFNNSGTVNVQSGTLSLPANDSGSTTGAFVVSAGATLSFQGNYSLATGSSVSGAGTVNFGGGGTVGVAGTYDVTGNSSFTGFTGAIVNFTSGITNLGNNGVSVTYGTVNFGTNNVTVTSLNFTGGTVTGTGGATLTIQGLFTWGGGTLSMPSTDAEGGIDFGGYSNAAFLKGGTLTNAVGASATFPAIESVTLCMENEATFNNAGTLTVSGGAINYDGGGSSSIVNSGTLNVAMVATGTYPSFEIYGPLFFVNSGAVNVQSGMLLLQAIGDQQSSTGTFAVSAGAELSFHDGYSLSTASSISGAGTVNFSGGTDTVTVGGEYDVTGSSSFTGATVNFTNAITNLGSGGVSVTAGTVNFGTNNVTASSLDFTNGTVTGTGSATLTIKGVFTWSGGTLSMPSTSAQGGIDFLNGVGDYLSGGTLTNATGASATFGWTGIVYLNMENGAAFVNAGTLNAGYDTIDSGSGATPTLANLGTLNVTAPAKDAFTIGSNLTFSNSGLINVESGTLSLKASVYNLTGSTLTGGVWQVRSDASLAFPGSSGITDDAASILLDGPGSQITLSGSTTNALATLNQVAPEGSLSLADGQSLAVTPAGGTLINDGTLALGPGSALTVSGNFSQPSEGTLAVQLAGDSSFGSVSSSGTAALGGSVQAMLASGYDPSAGTAFSVVSGATITNNSPTFTGRPTPSGRGLILRFDSTAAVIAIQPLATTTTLSAQGPNPSNATQPLSYTAAVSGGVPNGESVMLIDASNNNATVATGTLSNGSAALSVPAGTLLGGTHNLVAVYAGDASFAASQSAPYAQIVQVGIMSVTVNGNLPSLVGVQRSMVDSIVYSFSEAVNLTAANAFSISVHAGQGGTLPTALTWTALNANSDGSSTQWAVAFSGAGVSGGSIADGVYDLTLNTSAISVEGNPAAAITPRASDTFYRMFGDAQGTGKVNSADYSAFLSTYGLKSIDPGYLGYFADDGTAKIDAADYNAFLGNYGKKLSGFAATI